MQIKIMTLTAALGAGLLLAACGTTTEQRAATGALAGAAVGQAVGGDTESTVLGGVIGGVGGAVIRP